MYETAISLAMMFTLVFALAFSACGQEQAMFLTHKHRQYNYVNQ